LQVYAVFPLVGHTPEQHWLFDVHDVPPALHRHAELVLQVLSLQSTEPLQLSSMPLPQISLVCAQSVAHAEQFSPGSQTSLPQQYEPASAFVVVHWRPLVVQRESEHGIAPMPPPSPQQ
jgi:hypothetical protein